MAISADGLFILYLTASISVALDIRIQSFVDYLKFEKRYSLHTVRAYTDDLDQFFYYLDQEAFIREISQISAPMIRSWLAGLKEKKSHPNQ